MTKEEHKVYMADMILNDLKGFPEEIRSINADRTLTPEQKAEKKTELIAYAQHHHESLKRIQART